METTDKISTLEKIWNHHEASFRSGNLVEVVKDYASDAVIHSFTEFGESTTHKGKDAIRKLYQEVFVAFKEHLATMTAEFQAFSDNVIVFHWKLPDANVQGIDTFVIEDGLVVINTTRPMALAPARS